MNVLKNIEVARHYGISHTTVNNWIESSRKGRNKLKLVEKKDRFYIEDSVANQMIMEDLSRKGRIYKSKEERIVCSTQSEFFERFNLKQIGDIVNSLETYREIPHKYTYLKSGSKNWDEYANRSFEENIPNTVTNTDKMLINSFNFLVNNLEGESVKFNLVDIGIGNALPVKSLLISLAQSNLLNSYIGIDISPEILEIAEKNVREWSSKLNVKVDFQKYTRDITNEGFQDILIQKTASNQRVINLVMFIGSTIENQRNWRHTLESLIENLNKNDILILGQTLNNNRSKLYFDFKNSQERVIEKDKNSRFLSWKELVIPQLLSIPSDAFEVGMLYSTEEDRRLLQIVLTKDITVQIKSENIDKTIELFRGERIILWKHHHHSITEIANILDEVGLNLLHSTTSKDQAQVLTISKLKSV